MLVTVWLGTIEEGQRADIRKDVGHLSELCIYRPVTPGPQMTQKLAASGM